MTLPKSYELSGLIVLKVTKNISAQFFVCLNRVIEKGHPPERRIPILTNQTCLEIDYFCIEILLTACIFLLKLQVQAIQL